MYSEIAVKAWGAFVGSEVTGFVVLGGWGGECEGIWGTNVHRILMRWIKSSREDLDDSEIIEVD